MLISTKRALSDAKYSSSFWEHWNKCQCLFWYLLLPFFLCVLRCVGCKSISSHHLMYFFQLVCCMCVLFLLCAFGYFLNLNTPPPQKRKKNATRDEPEITLHILEIGGPTFSSVLCTRLLMWSKWPAVCSQVAQSNQKQNKNPSRLCLMIGSHPMRALGLYGPTALKWRGVGLCLCVWCQSSKPRWHFYCMRVCVACACTFVSL